MSSLPQVKRVAYVNDILNRENNPRELNADFSFPVVVEAKVSEWQVSPKEGIKQMCFERVGRKKPRLTTLAKFPAGRSFKKFGHEAGVEFFVLSGIFSDADGDYGAGCYVRNPASTYHEPFTRECYTVLFKLGQFQSLDRKRVI